MFYYARRHQNVKITPHNYYHYTSLYKAAKEPSTGLGGFLECRKCSILTIAQALVLWLIYTHLPSGAVHPRASCVYIRQSTCTCVITITYICMYVCTSVVKSAQWHLTTLCSVEAYFLHNSLHSNVRKYTSHPTHATYISHYHLTSTQITNCHQRTQPPDP